MSEQIDNPGRPAGEAPFKLSPASRQMLAYFQLCWQRTRGTFFEATLSADRGVRYSQHRDITNILAAVLPAAAEFAASSRPDLAGADSALVQVAGKYALCLSAGDEALDALTEGFAPLVHNSEAEGEAFALFSVSFTLSMLVYILCTPHLCDNLGTLHKDLHARTLAGIARVGAVGRFDDAPFWKRWLRRVFRRRRVSALLADGLLPKSDWVARFASGEVPKTVWEIMEALLASGAVTDTGAARPEAGDESA